MARPTLTMLARFLSAGLVLGVGEALFVLVRDHRMFLSPVEFGRYALVAVAVASALCVWVGSLGWVWLSLLKRGADGQQWARRSAITVFAVALPVAGAVLWLLTEGRRARAIEGRWLWVLGLAAAAALLLAWLSRILFRLGAMPGGSSRRRAGLVLLGLALCAVAVDGMVLRRLYPTFHWALVGQAVVLTLLGSVMVWSGQRLVRGRALLGTLAVVAGPLLLVDLGNAPNLRFAVEESAPMTGKWLRLVAAPRANVAPTPVVSAVSAPGTGIDLAGKDVLLITVDALRADRLQARPELTPRMNELGAGGMVFDRAYTVTPHTSYSVSSLMTGKYLREVMSLPEAPKEHVTLASLLRRHGYRTAAFYPPAVFYVDEQRFEGFEKRRFDFEYSKQMFAGAARRVAQVGRYVEAAPEGLPLFVWTHFFEPHEPYEPPEGMARDDSPEARYDGEVAVVDAAVGRLVALFRKARPGATVILTSDHGEEFGEHGGSHHGTTLYDEQVRVPLIWSSPGTVAPGRTEVPTETIDIATTLLSALGIPRDARMRGDDLGAVLRGDGRGFDTQAFASVDDLRMVVRGPNKAICRDLGACRVFNLERDPAEQMAIKVAPQLLGSLRSQLSGFIASIARGEALAMDDGSGWPRALVRARLGDETSVDGLVPLLYASRATLRSRAARYLGRYGAVAQLPVLDRMRVRDADAEVRGEAAIASLKLGERAAMAQVRGLLTAGGGIAGRAAFALAAEEDAAAAPALVSMALDDGAEEQLRKRALVSLRSASLASGTIARNLFPLLDDVRLRPTVAETLGKIGGPRAARRLTEALQTERYPQARRAEIEALLALGDPHVVRWVRNYLGTEIGLPGGVSMLWRLGVIEKPSGLGALLSDRPQLRRGNWQCRPSPCSPGADASIRLPDRSVRGPVRVVLWISVREGTEPAWVQVLGHRTQVEAGERQVSVVHDARLRDVPVSASSRVGVLGIAVVPATEDPPPPAPEPWDGGTPDAASP